MSQLHEDRYWELLSSSQEKHPIQNLPGVPHSRQPLALETFSPLQHEQEMQEYLLCLGTCKRCQEWGWVKHKEKGYSWGSKWSLSEPFGGCTLRWCQSLRVDLSGSWWALKALVKCADRSLMFMSPSREEGCRLPASSKGFPEERTYNSKTRHLYKHLTGGLALGQRIFWLFFFFPTRSIMWWESKNLEWGGHASNRILAI